MDILKILRLVSLSQKPPPQLEFVCMSAKELDYISLQNRKDLYDCFQTAISCDAGHVYYIQYVVNILL